MLAARTNRFLRSTRVVVAAKYFPYLSLHAPARTPALVRNIRLCVASVDEQQEASTAVPEGAASQAEQPSTAMTTEPQEGAPSRPELPSFEVDPELARELELEELDSAQEQLLSWMLLSEEEQEEDLDEMVDYDEFGDEEYEELFEQVEQMFEAADVELKVGDKVTGTVYEVDDDGAYVEIGQKYSGFVPLSECSFARLKTPLEVLRIGMKREFMVVENRDEYGQVILSLAAGEASTFWYRMRQMQEENMTVTVKVESANRGGLLVKYGIYEGFTPVSQFGPDIKPETMESLIGSDLPVKFLEVDEEKERLVFSHKRAAGTSAPNFGGFKIGEVVEGTVQTMRPYGAFLDLGNNVVGLLHVSQLSSERVLSIDKVIREGDRLKVMVLSMDAKRSRVTLSTKKLEPTPGDMLRDPQLVYEKAEEMAKVFQERITTAKLLGEDVSQLLGPDVNYPAGQYDF